jgi:hypothetical protein
MNSSEPALPTAASQVTALIDSVEAHGVQSRSDIVAAINMLTPELTIELVRPWIALTDRLNECIDSLSGTVDLLTTALEQRAPA